MYLCINCNAQGVKRDGDAFKCPKCKYEWDVAHEQANAAYLESQGRKPAKPLGEHAVEVSPEDDWRARLGITPGTPAGTGDQDVASVEVNDDDESDPVEAIPVELREPAPLDAQAYQMLVAALEKKTVPALEEIADDAQIDLSDARLKDDKIARLADSGRISLADDGESIVATLVREEDVSEG